MLSAASELDLWDVIRCFARYHSYRQEPVRQDVQVEGGGGAVPRPGIGRTAAGIKQTGQKAEAAGRPLAQPSSLGQRGGGSGG